MNSLLRRLLPWTFPVVLVGAYVWSVLAATAATEPSVGEIQDVKGRGWGISALGEKYDKLGGDLVVMDEVVATGFNSAMTLRFIDKTTMTLGPNAEITIDQMVYNPDDGDNDAVTLRLGKGSFYFVSGLVAKNKVTILTPTATIGIRGTELVIDVDADGSTSVGVAKGHAFMRSTRDGRSVEVEVGNTARINDAGIVGDPFPGVDLTGDEDVDRKIPGVSEWLDDDEREDEKDQIEFAAHKRDGEHDEQGDDKAKRNRRNGEDGGRLTENDDEGHADDTQRGDEVASNESDHSAEAGEHDKGESDREGRERAGGERDRGERESRERESRDRDRGERDSSSNESSNESSSRDKDDD
jgi:hypothetical protein